jgi:hypothetical protein
MHRSSLRFGQAVCLAVATLAMTSATAFGAQSGPVVLHLRFRTLANHVNAFPLGSGTDVAFTTWRQKRTVLLDDSTGKRTLVSGCGSGSSSQASLFANSWLVFDCYPDRKWRFQLYNVRTGHWRRLLCDRACKRNSKYIAMDAVGAKWLLVSVLPHQSCGLPDPVKYECGPTIYLYYNIATGKRGFPHPGTNKILDLSSPTITSRPCAPVSVPPGSALIPRPLAVDRGFAFVQSPNGIYVQRCGSSHQTYLTTNPDSWDASPFWGATTNQFFGNQHAAGLCCGHFVGATAMYDFSGYFLPSLTPFTAAVPKYSPAALLGPRHLYMYSTSDSSDFSLIAATFPSTATGTGG